MSKEDDPTGCAKRVVKDRRGAQGLLRTIQGKGEGGHCTHEAGAAPFSLDMCTHQQGLQFLPSKRSPHTASLHSPQPDEGPALETLHLHNASGALSASYMQQCGGSVHTVYRHHYTILPINPKQQATRNKQARHISVSFGTMSWWRPNTWAPKWATGVHQGLKIDLLQK